MQIAIDCSKKVAVIGVESQTNLGFLRGTDERTKRTHFCVLAQKWTWQGQSEDEAWVPKELKFSFLGTWLFPPKRLELSVRSSLSVWSVVLLDYPMFPLGNIGQLASYWLGPISFSCLCHTSPLETVYKVLYFFISLLGLRHILCKTSNSRLFSLPSILLIF